MTNERTIAFVDLAGFTALTGIHGELVKTVGDAVMLAGETASGRSPGAPASPPIPDRYVTEASS